MEEDGSKLHVEAQGATSLHSLHAPVLTHEVRMLQTGQLEDLKSLLFLDETPPSFPNLLNTNLKIGISKGVWKLLCWKLHK